MDDIKFFAGTGNPELAQKVAASLNIPIGSMAVRRFSDGEISIQIEQSVRGDDIFLLQSAAYPVNDYLVELLIIIDAFKRASARRINVILPYYFYSRQDKKVRPREPVTAKLVANLVTEAGASRLLSVDLHSGQIVGFADIPFDHLYAGPIIAEYLLENIHIGDDCVVVSPDVGGVTRARALAEMLGTPIAIVVKRRPEPNKSEVMEVIGDVKGKTAIMIDDIIDTGGSILNGAKALIDRGAKEVYAACTHPVFSGDAADKLLNSPIKKVIVTDTIPLGEKKRDSKIEVVSVANLLADAIIRIHEESSISEIFERSGKKKQ